jgi:Cupin-like domain
MTDTTARLEPFTAASAASSGKAYKWIRWSSEETAAFGRRPLLARHRLHEGPLFSRDALLDLMESYPRDRVQVFTMGTDVTRKDDWEPVEVGRGSGRELWEAIARGRLWFKLLHVHVVDRRYGDLLDELYAELAEQCPGFIPVRKSATLLISSPTALVYYHADAQPNLLWHIHGSKRVWVYPSGDRELISQDLMEDIFAGFADEEAPYEARFDEKATVFEMHPGDVLSWPQNAPHRVTNQHGVNVSLSTVHETPESDRRKLIYCGNRLLRRGYHLPFRSVKETGVVAYGKRTAYRALRRFGLVEIPSGRAYVTKLRMDASAPEGMRAIEDGPELTEFSRKYFRLERDGAGRTTAVRIRDGG